MSNTAFAEAEEQFVITEAAPEAVAEERPERIAAMNLHMFVDCLVEPDTSDRKRKRWTTFTSLTVQCLMLGVAILIPLMFTEVLPTQQLVTFLVAPPPPPPPPPPAVVASAPIRHILTEVVSGRLTAPTKIPDKIKMIKEDEAPPGIGFGVVGGVVGGTSGGQLGGVIGGIIASTNSHPTVLASGPAPAKRLRISQGVAQGRLINRVVPEYPTIAKLGRIQGTVQLSAWIGRDGSVERLTVLSGNPLLVTAAIDAVKQWRYKPFLLNGEPIEVESTIEVNFSFNGNGS